MAREIYILTRFTLVVSSLMGLGAVLALAVVGTVSWWAPVAVWVGADVVAYMLRLAKPDTVR